MSVTILTLKSIFQAAYQKYIVERQRPCCTTENNMYRRVVYGIEYRDLIGWSLTTEMLDQLDLYANNALAERRAFDPDNCYDMLEDCYPSAKRLLLDWKVIFGDNAPMQPDDSLLSSAVGNELVYRLPDASLAGLTYLLHDILCYADANGVPYWTIPFDELKQKYDIIASLNNWEIPSEADQTAT